MPIYAYKCESCGHARDVLQKMSDAPLTECPLCGASTFRKQLTAAGFQLKGSGWYATDFKGGSSATPPADSGGSSTGGTGGEAPSAPKAEASTAGAAGCGTSCACH
jgi:putative FmdB family regulatory protein